MSYQVQGLVVERTESPRFRMILRLDENDNPQPGDIEWIDDPPPDVYLLTGYLQQAVDAWRRAQ